MALIVSYSDGYRTWEDAVQRTQRRLGNIFVMVVKERRRNSESIDFTYGFFFRSSDGILFDVHKKSKSELRTLFRAESVIEELDAIYEGLFDSFDIPVKAERNVIKPGGLAKATLPPLAYHYANDI